MKRYILFFLLLVIAIIFVARTYRRAPSETENDRKRTEKIRLEPNRKITETPATNSPHEIEVAIANDSETLAAEKNADRRDVIRRNNEEARIHQWQTPPAPKEDQ